ncbi:NAD(+)--rifampin ADP-ribosyltransferase [Rhodococcus fascians]|uniref:NAD(+)--rifampin ADP-ribosyltransferase n=1 Tax=Rhodococcoides fascians TaxID=1828 RepID=UPI00195D1BD5|nr:NAD(+)--rifampin ADP-ribosyltransferase [Rhodococcus fascians]MBM7242692.1 NAD(+)--rifampin ADP-ribosyltransferase [Rhodococcus fascians]MBY3809212.1 NAD(+)--rifampin ADP-ribosyltransferase [Rhodococcus fascians]MBY3840840.1 NAD(+)--rifampin ADP-ribosyltransferase [Rhodococcus fascians]MBY3846383.1 NAD(+)--rifampin ADP-ribosyltransferase [Rhodococcus fascians]MBY3851046.1 NAD(+)--rifampin ADP-ribosyltransferase [Rhodococcus fascians]
MADTPERFRVHESGAYFHGTKADLKAGDYLSPGYRSNYHPEHISNYIYMTRVLDGAVLAAEMAVGEGPPRVYIVQPTGSVEDDPNVTDKKFPGNPTHCYRNAEPVRIVEETSEWVGHSPEYLSRFREGLEKLRQTGTAILYD